MHVHSDSDPYAILGVSRQASLQQVKARYFELARKHHPDKLGNVSQEERDHHENIFKEVTNAYSSIEHQINTGQGTYSGTGTDAFTGNNLNREDWRSVWNDIETLFQTPGTWEAMINIVKNTVSDVTVQGIKKLRTHHIKVPVTLEEVHAKKKKKVRLFLADIEDPIFTTIDVGEYPIVDIKYPDPNIPGLMINITVTMELSKHPIYRLDDVLDSWDLFTEVTLTWLDFIKGRDVTLPYLDGTDLHVTFEPFQDYTKVPIVFQDKGLCGLGNVYVSVTLELPNISSKKIWDELGGIQKEFVLNFVKSLY